MISNTMNSTADAA